MRKSPKILRLSSFFSFYLENHLNLICQTGIWAAQILVQQVRAGWPGGCAYTSGVAEGCVWRLYN